MKAIYAIERVIPDISHKSNGIVFIVDENVERGVINDTESVVIDVLSRYPNHRIVYRDTQGNWDELFHWKGRFVGFNLYQRA